jgi:hypothetical protein
MATRDMTIDQAKLKVKATLRGLRDVEKFLKENPGLSPSHQFGEDYNAVYYCIFDNIADLKKALPGRATYPTNIRDGKPKETYIDFRCWYEQLAELLQIEI